MSDLLPYFFACEIVLDQNNWGTDHLYDACKLCVCKGCVLPFRVAFIIHGCFNKRFRKERGNKYLQIYVFIFFWAETIPWQSQCCGSVILAEAAVMLTKEHATSTCTGLRFPLWELLRDWRLELHINSLCIDLLPLTAPLPCLATSSSSFAASSGTQPPSSTSVAGSPHLTVWVLLHTSMIREQGTVHKPSYLQIFVALKVKHMALWLWS